MGAEMKNQFPLGPLDVSQEYRRRLGIARTWYLAALALVVVLTAFAYIFFRSGLDMDAGLFLLIWLVMMVIIIGGNIASFRLTSCPSCKGKLNTPLFDTMGFLLVFFPPRSCKRCHADLNIAAAPSGTDTAT